MDRFASAIRKIPGSTTAASAVLRGLGAIDGAMGAPAASDWRRLANNVSNPNVNWRGNPNPSSKSTGNMTTWGSSVLQDMLQNTTFSETRAQSALFSLVAWSAN